MDKGNLDMSKIQRYLFGLEEAQKDKIIIGLLTGRIEMTWLETQIEEFDRHFNF